VPARNISNNGLLGREKRLKLKKKARLEKITSRFGWVTSEMVEERLASIREHAQHFFRRSPGELESTNELFIKHYAMNYEEAMLFMALRDEDERRRGEEREEDRIYVEFMQSLNEQGRATFEGAETLRQLGEELDR
jgi:hypothetical protein